MVTLSLPLPDSDDESSTDDIPARSAVPLGYRSATEYQLHEEQEDAVVETVAYHRKDFGPAVIGFSPGEHAGIRPSIATPFRLASNTAALFSPIDRLPLELLHDVLLHLDIHSLFWLRQTSLWARQAVDALAQYRLVATHGLDLFCALLRTRLAGGVSLADFCDMLGTAACAVCGGFGGFVFLLTWQRCCFTCLRKAPELQVRTLASVVEVLGPRSRREADQHLRSFKTLPGTYTLEASAYKARFRVVSLQQALDVGGRLQWGPGVAPQSRLFYYDHHGYGQRAQVQARTRTPRQEVLNCMGACALPYYNTQTGKAEHGLSCAGCQLALEKNIGGMSQKDWAFEIRDREYAEEGFLEHFRWCRQAQLLWESSAEGAKQPSELPAFVQKQGLLGRSAQETEE